MARRKAAAARPTKTAVARRGTRKSAVRKAAARKSRSTARKSTARKSTSRKTASRRPRPAARKAATKTVAPKARKTPVKTAKATRKSAPARKAAVARKTARPVRKPALDRERRRLSGEDIVQSTPPSSLDMDRHATAARSGAAGMEERLEEHTETGPAITAGDVDADWEAAYSVGDEAPGGDNPTPDQDVVDDIGKALGVEYQDNEELKSADKITKRDKHRWELDPASSDDWTDR